MKPQINRTDHESEVANYVSMMIEESKRTQKDIAIDAGFSKSVNVLTLIKTGKMKLAVDRVLPLCKACGQEPSELMRLVLQEYMPSVLEVVGEIKGEVISDDEAAIIDIYRMEKTKAINIYRGSHRKRAVKAVLVNPSVVAKAINKSINVHAA